METHYTAQDYVLFSSISYILQQYPELKKCRKSLDKHCHSLRKTLRTSHIKIAVDEFCGKQKLNKDHFHKILNRQGGVRAVDIVKTYGLQTHKNGMENETSVLQPETTMFQQDTTVSKQDTKVLKQKTRVLQTQTHVLQQRPQDMQQHLEDVQPHVEDMQQHVEDMHTEAKPKVHDSFRRIKSEEWLDNGAGGKSGSNSYWNKENDNFASQAALDFEHKRGKKFKAEKSKKKKSSWKGVGTMPVGANSVFFDSD